MLTDDLTGVDFFLWSDEEATTALEVVEGIGVGRPVSRAMIEPLLRRSISPFHG